VCAIQTALVTAPVSMQPASAAGASSGGWFGFGSKKPAPALPATPGAAAAGSGDDARVTRTYTASKADLAQLAKLQTELQQVYSA